MVFCTCRPTVSIYNVIGLSRSGKTTLILKLTEKTPPELDLTGDLTVVARAVDDLYDPDFIVGCFLSQPGAFDSKHIAELFNSYNMQLMYKSKNQLKSKIVMSHQLEYIIPNIKRLCTSDSTPYDRLYGYHPTPKTTSHLVGSKIVIEAKEPIENNGKNILVCSLLDYFEVDDRFDNRFIKSVALYESLVDATVVFTHLDLFHRFITRIPFRTGSRFPGYTGPMLEDAVSGEHVAASMIDFLKTQFVGCKRFYLIKTPDMSRDDLKSLFNL
jgi:hypothetical protein